MARKTETADALDKHIANRIREYRENLGMTQGDLAKRADVSYQQIHKYECGSNRISAGRLGLIAQVLDQSIEAFYSGFEKTPVSVSQEEAEEGRLCLEVARSFRQIENRQHKKALYMLIRELSKELPQ